ncbi:MAG: tRNA uridine-5-carboxymethylaminomethyl(34) synthesis GTPase MnmE [Desulfuromonadales bacterium]|nr:tRNA uridine-5-carboxymethylaminomethyl(34) synthesis GTPase MnmE [Desulfuromonadales bacterium]
MILDKDTIIAPATAVSESGIAVIRISGYRALSFLKSFFRTKNPIENFQSHYLYLGRIVDEDDSDIDEVMVVYMDPPRTYTCEPVVEVHCHGSRQIVRRILQLAYANDIRLANPGEFTYRAYLNGRIDLVQAEAVSRLIQSTSEFSRRSALQQLDGLLSRQLHSYSATIKNLLVQTEAWIDFPEEDLPTENLDRLFSTAENLHVQMSDLMNTYRAGQFVHDGATVVLAGLPNAGKSSLMNALLQQDRSIVSSVPGTTRDLIEQSTQIGGINVRLVDTAGLRSSDEFVEQEGVRRARNVVKIANLVLLMLDGSAPLCDQFRALLADLSAVPVVLVVNKSDLLSEHHDLSFFPGPIVTVSAKLGDGIDVLTDTIASFLLNDYLPSSESPYITERRHYEALTGSVSSIKNFLNNLGSVDLDLLSIDLRSALDSLGRVTGSITTEDVLDDIFSSFCIGK